jgi:hypothetical protein
MGSDRTCRRTLNVLGSNHHNSGVALKVLATWGAVYDSGWNLNFYACG